MYLKEIRAQGFKSFADKTIIKLDKNITGVVGPNGSGKSNVVDAVRWVLGEQSVKSLRGADSMTDVIFAGSKSRKALNVASVTLVFDNTDHYLPLSYDEVAVRRRVYADGTNEFSINEEKVRLKDIQNLFMDSGIGKDSFNIISQGKVEAILSDKPEDRRVIFEEAAGVLKYKKRKIDAIRKLEKTEANIDRISDIIKELETQVEPLKEASAKALKYNELNGELESIEVSLITNDITTINYEYQEAKSKVEVLKNELLEITSTNSNNEAIIEEYKLKIAKIDEEIRNTQTELLEITSEVEKLNSRKTLVLEREKYSVEDAKLHDNVVNLKETLLKNENALKEVERDIVDSNNSLKEVESKINNLNSSINKIKDSKTKEETELSNYIREENKLKTKISSLEDDIDNNATIPYAVRSILNNPKLSGIHDVIGSLVDTDSVYSLAISTALGSSSSFIVVDNEICAKEAINYLKNNNIGRATFFPLNIIKPKAIEEDVLNNIKGLAGYIGIASDITSFDPRYRNIILNQLGNIIVVDNIDNANNMAKKIQNRYRIVTLEGDLINVGGSITGGKVKVRNIISDKYELDKAKKELEVIINKIKTCEESINNISNELKGEEDKLYIVNKDKIELEAILNTKAKTYNDINNSIEETKRNIDGTNNMINNALSDEESKIMDEYYKAQNKKDEIIHKSEKLSSDRSSLNEALVEFEYNLKKENGLYNSKTEELHNLEISVNRMDVKLDNLLNTLNETYNMTYEKAKDTYRLEIEVDVARSKVSSLKRSIKELGPINPDAPSEYENVSKRYEFLLKQRDDLVNASNMLLDIINEMDTVMKKEFMKTFEIIKDEFSNTFKELFKGGRAILKLTDEDNVLETGIEIEAMPPGKTLKNISLLSGGEKTFTAISLLFAIVKTRTMPFCILDEVEAALDEANVEGFGEYITNLKKKTQFIIITHKKKTMEYADVLYGITMQESGVSKLVSVKLEDIKK
ncbi:MAG: chromosome segregation protein SMC [Bacilli bacterium]|nr:chromosome segregation protein SMC [Bacilli bacterium]